MSQLASLRENGFDPTVPPADITVRRAVLAEIQSMREAYRREMNCQIIHDSLHIREGWTIPHLLTVAERVAGYGSVAVAGPWRERPAVFEFHVEPAFRGRVFELFHVFLQVCGARMIETQSNDFWLTMLLHASAYGVMSDAILFADAGATEHAPAGVSFRMATTGDKFDIRPEQLPAHGVIEFEGAVVGRGGVLFHYNAPYGDVYMEVEAAFRRRGFGAFLVQELKRVCRGLGRVPGARCDPTNIASRQTLLKAGFLPCGHMLVGTVVPDL